MTTVKSAAVFLLFCVFVFTGCAMMSNPNQPVAATAPPASTPPPSSTPPPTTPPPPPPTPPPPPSFPTQFIYTADDSDTASIRGFKINADGSLSAVSGSPFAAQRVAYVKGVGTSLMVESGLKLLYSVDSSTGAIQLQATSGDFFGEIIPDPLPTVFHSNEVLPLHFPPLDTVSIAGGKISTLQTFIDPAGQGWFQVMAVDPTGGFIYGAERPGQGQTLGTTPLGVVTRNADGTAGRHVANPDRPLCQTVLGNGAPAVTAKGTHTFLYHACSSPDELGYTVINNTSGKILNSGNLSNVFGVPSQSLIQTDSITVDPSGSFLLMINSKAGSLDIYTIDQSTGIPGPPINRFQTGDTPRSVMVDATGQYVYLLTSQCGLALFPPCNDQSTIHAYGMIGGNLTPLPVQSYPAGISSRSLALVKF